MARHHLQWPVLIRPHHRGGGDIAVVSHPPLGALVSALGHHLGHPGASKRVWPCVLVRRQPLQTPLPVGGLPHLVRGDIRPVTLADCREKIRRILGRFPALDWGGVVPVPGLGVPGGTFHQIQRVIVPTSGHGHIHRCPVGLADIHHHPGRIDRDPLAGMPGGGIPQLAMVGEILPWHDHALLVVITAAQRDLARVDPFNLPALTVAHR